MDSCIPPPGVPAGQPATTRSESPPHSAPPLPAPLTLEDLANRVADGEAATARCFEGMRKAFAELRSEMRHLLDARQAAPSFPDDPRRRLNAFLGYLPTAEQQAELFQALAAFHATNPRLTPNCTASYATKKGGQISYSYADFGEVIATGQKAAPFGLSVITCQEFDDNGQAIVTGYLLHSNGGAISSGPVPLYVGESERPGQAHSAGLTTCRRLAHQMALGLAAERDDDGNANHEIKTGAPRAAAPRLANPPSRPAGSSTARPVQGPPPGWLSKQERLALEGELQSPSITPERFAEIEDRLRAASNSISAPGIRAAGAQP
jgi:hypothetical protein